MKGELGDGWNMSQSVVAPLLLAALFGCGSSSQPVQEVIPASCQLSWNSMTLAQQAEENRLGDFSKRCRAADWVALCRDKVVRFSESPDGICADHGGISGWIKVPDA